MLPIGLENCVTPDGGASAPILWLSSAFLAKVMHRSCTTGGKPSFERTAPVLKRSCLRFSATTFSLVMGNTKQSLISRLSVIFLILFSGILLSVGTNQYLDYRIAEPFAKKDFRAAKIPSDAKKIVLLSEIFGHGFGACVFCLTCFLLDTSNRRKLLRIGSCLVLSGIAVTIIKFNVLRVRPFSFDFSGSSFLDVLSSRRFAIDNSFPSGHTATAFCLALCLSRLYPKGRYLFFLLAILASAERVISAQHFPSDVVAGAVIGYCAYCLCFNISPIAQFFSRFERLKTVSEPITSGNAADASTEQSN